MALGLGDGPPPAQLLVASAVLALLQQAAKEQPLLLIVDDLPWLDRANALVLGMVARRLAGLPVGLLAACRTGEPSFFDQGNLPVAHVPPLPEEAAAELLASRYPMMTARVRRRLLDATGQPARPARAPSLPRRSGPAPSPAPGPRRCRWAAACRRSSPPASRRCPARPASCCCCPAHGTGHLRLIRAIAADRGEKAWN